MSTIDTSTWNPDADLNVEIEGIPLNADASIVQTWQVIRILMAAFKGDTRAIQALMVPFTGATAFADGASGFVPAPDAGDESKVLKGDGTWGTLSASDIPNIDASKITSGTIDLARLPAGALERLVTVANQTARYALTTASVQLGDTVKEADTGLLYFVVDTAHLDSDAGYEVYTAGAASAVPWSGVTGKPSTFTPSSHTHGSITNDGKLGTASRVVVTDGSKAIGVSSVTTTELGYLSGVTSAVQTQISSKADDSAVVHKTGNESISGTKTFNGLKVQNGIAGINKDNTVESANDLWLSSAGDAGKKQTYYTTAIGSTKLTDIPSTTSTTIESYTVRRNSATDWVVNQILHNTSSNLYFRRGTGANGGTWSAWKTFAFTDSNITGNAASASTVPWTGVTGKPSTFTPSSHTHGNLTSDGKIGSTAGFPIITGTGGMLQAGAMIGEAQIEALFA